MRYLLLLLLSGTAQAFLCPSEGGPFTIEGETLAYNGKTSTGAYIELDGTHYWGNAYLTIAIEQDGHYTMRVLDQITATGTCIGADKVM